MEIVIPYAPRPLQLSLHAEMQAKRWGVVVCHRRFGKTVWAINHILRDAIMCDRAEPPVCLHGTHLSPGEERGLGLPKAVRRRDTWRKVP
jgi:hypothetical protein